MPTSLLPQGSDGTIPVDEAEQQTANWRAYLATQKGLITKAFLIPIENFQNMIANNPDAEGLRVYLALKTAGDPTSMTVVVVPVVNGNDVITLPTGTLGTGDPDDPDDDSNVYNGAIPCPPTCNKGPGGLGG